MRVLAAAGEGAGVSDYQQLMARLCATQFATGSSAGQQGQAWLQGGKMPRPVQASDITVLVRGRNEAALVRDALSALSIPSVYLSNRDSVFDTRRPKTCCGCCRRCWRRSKSARCAARWPPG